MPRIAIQHKEGKMVGLLKRVYRQYRSAAHRKGLQELKHLAKQTRTIAGKLRAGKELDDGDKRRLEELKDKLVAFPRWLMAEWRLADMESVVTRLGSRRAKTSSF